MNAFRLLFSLCSGLAIFAGCGGSQPPIGTPAVPQVRSREPSFLLSRSQLNTRRLLFVSGHDSPGDVYLYALPSLAFVGSFTTPTSLLSGECADADGDVWIVGAPFVYEYSHTGVLESTLSVPDSDGYFVNSCAVSPQGNLAVGDTPGGGGLGHVWIYPDASGTPYAVNNPSQAGYSFLGYDDKGNLFVDGQHRYMLEDFILSECVAPCTSGSSLHTILVNGPRIYTAGMVEWDRKRKKLAIGDQMCDDKFAACVYWVKLNESYNATIKGVTALQIGPSKPPCFVYQATLNHADEKILGSNWSVIECYTGRHTAVFSWRANGGTPVRSDTTAPESPWGAAISEIPR
jgi:hypothetical protein